MANVLRYNMQLNQGSSLNIFQIVLVTRKIFPNFVLVLVRLSLFLSHWIADKRLIVGGMCQLCHFLVVGICLISIMQFVLLVKNYFVFIIEKCNHKQRGDSILNLDLSFTQLRQSTQSHLISVPSHFSKHPSRPWILK